MRSPLRLSAMTYRWESDDAVPALDIAAFAAEFEISRDARSRLGLTVITYSAASVAA